MQQSRLAVKSSPCGVQDMPHSPWLSGTMSRSGRRATARGHHRKRETHVGQQRAMIARDHPCTWSAAMPPRRSLRAEADLQLPDASPPDNRKPTPGPPIPSWGGFEYPRQELNLQPSGPQPQSCAGTSSDYHETVKGTPALYPSPSG
jgi:hypothetical protein